MEPDTAVSSVPLPGSTVYSPMEGNLGSLHILAIMGKTAMKIDCGFSFQLFR